MRNGRLGGLLALPALASCSLFLDFDALQKGSGGTTGTGGSAGSGTGGTSGAGTSGAGGTSGMSGSGTSGESAGGSPECPAECFHDDPCLLDGCNSDGTCR